MNLLKIRHRLGRHMEWEVLHGQGIIQADGMTTWSFTAMKCASCGLERHQNVLHPGESITIPTAMGGIDIESGSFTWIEEPTE